MNILGDLHCGPQSWAEAPRPCSLVAGVLVLGCQPLPRDSHPASSVDPAYILFCQASLTLPIPQQMLKEGENVSVLAHACVKDEGSRVCLLF